MVYYCASPSERRLKNVFCCTRFDGGGVANVHEGKLESVKDFKGFIGIKAGPNSKFGVWQKM